MNILTKNNWEKIKDNKILGIFFLSLLMLIVAIIVANGIVKEKWIYLGIVFCPFLIYLSIKNPFIFPFGLYAFLLPFDSILAVGEREVGNTVTKLLGVASIIVLSITGIVERKLKKPDKTVIWWGLFVALGCLSIWWAIEPELTYERIPTAIGLYLLYIIVASYKIKENEFELVKKLIIYGGVTASMYAIISYLSCGAVYKGTFRASMVAGERATDPNQFAFSLLIPLSLTLSDIMYSERKFVKIINCGFFGIIFFAITISGSRGALVGIAAIVFTFILSKKKNYLMIVVIPTMIAIFYYLPEMFIQRISDSYDTGGAGRWDIWKVGLEALKHYYFLGAGLSNFPLAYTEFMYMAPEFHGFDRGSHNIYLCFAVELGIVGFTFMSMAIYKHYTLLKKTFSRYDMNSIMLKAALFGLLISSFFLDVVWRKSFWLIWMLIMMYTTIKSQDAKWI